MSDHGPLVELPEESNYGAVDESHSIYSEETKTEPRGFLRRFWWLCLLGIGAMIVADLTFLPRTSPNRDYRRWHGLKLTKADVERLFLTLLRPGGTGSDGFTTEDHIYMYLRNLSDINGRTPTSIAGSETPELTRYLREQMSEKFFDTKIYEYGLPLSLRTPLSLNLTLYDTKSSRELYTTALLELQTPAYFTFSRNGLVRQTYVNTNYGTPDDYALLKENNILVSGKVVVFSHSLNSEYSLTDKILLAESLSCAGVIVYGEKKSPQSISRDFKPLNVPLINFRLPVSYAQVEPILNTFVPPKGPFKNWQHGPMTDGNLELEIACSFLEEALRSVNIVSTMKSALHDGVVIVGAARDSLTTSNPMSGHAIMLEIMRNFVELRKLGWLPLRTIKFVSWDASRSGALGAAAAINDAKFLAHNSPVLAYINLDGDTVTGSDFVVDSHPALNHILRHIAKVVSNPSDNPENALFDGERKLSSLFDYWKLQNNASINNRLGHDLAGKNIGMFQLFKQVNSINIQFKNKPESDKTFVPESNMYDLAWLKDQDKGFRFHATLARFVGLLLISLGETEVIDQSMTSYFDSLRIAHSGILSDYKDLVFEWKDEDITKLFEEFVPDASLFKDVQQVHKKGNVKELAVTWEMTLDTFNTLLLDLVNTSSKFDTQTKHLADLWTTDYPWFKLPKKLLIYLKVKSLNRILLGFDQNLSKCTKPWQQYQNSPQHVAFETPAGILPSSELHKRGVFASIYEAYDAKSLKYVVIAMADKYEKLKNAVSVLK